jgi:hypothetical protein
LLNLPFRDDQRIRANFLNIFKHRIYCRLINENELHIFNVYRVLNNERKNQFFIRIEHYFDVLCKSHSLAHYNKSQTERLVKNLFFGIQANVIAFFLSNCCNCKDYYNELSAIRKEAN